MWWFKNFNSVLHAYLHSSMARNIILKMKGIRLLFQGQIQYGRRFSRCLLSNILLATATKYNNKQRWSSKHVFICYSFSIQKWPIHFFLFLDSNKLFVTHTNGGFWRKYTVVIRMASQFLRSDKAKKRNTVQWTALDHFARSLASLMYKVATKL